MASIQAVGTALPQHIYSSADVKGIGEVWLQDEPRSRELFDRFLQSSHTGSRHFVLSPDEILSLGGLSDRAALFEEHGPQLGVNSLQRALTLTGIPAEEINTLVFTSCSCPVIPSIDALIVEHSELSRNVMRVPVYQQGCAGGVVGLQVANALVQARGPVALTSVELCSLVFQRGNSRAAQLVGAAIFADGAATIIVSPEDRGLVILSAQSYLMPDSRHLMGYDLLDDGFHLRLDKDLPRALVQAAPEQVRAFLAKSNLATEEIDYWLFHPGGTKILDFLEQSFNLTQEKCHWARDVLSSVGNLSSATVLYVLESFFNSKVAKDGDRILMMGVGPGLTLELVLFEYRS